MTEQNLEDFLRENRPAVKDDPTFLMETRRRMDAVEGIKQEVDRQRRNGRSALFITLLAGLVTGAILSAFVILYPAEISSFENEVLHSVQNFLIRWKFLLMAATAGCAIALGLLLIRRPKNAIF